jgi:hypothetical protein
MNRNIMTAVTTGWVVCLSMLLAGACNQRSTPNSNGTGGTTPGAATVQPELAVAERQKFYHMEEGSEVFPIDWLRALNRAGSDQPYLRDTERFGLLADPVGPTNPYGLPVGLTAAPTRDLRFSGVKMLGINCAACHVNELTYQGKKLRIDGAPNLFNTAKFYDELGQAALATLKSPKEFLAFLKRLRALNDPQSTPPTDAEQQKMTATVSALPAPGAPQEADKFEQELAAKLTARLLEEQKGEAADIRQGLIVQEDAATPAGTAAARRKKLTGAQTLDKLSALVPKQKIEPGSELAKVAPETELKNKLLPNALRDALDTFRLLKARVKFVLDLTGSNINSTNAGFGRVDAFGGARNLLFPKERLPTTAPVSYPHLWGFDRLVWVHWDANTTSVLERNIGQSLGLGAIYDPQTNISTVRVENIHALEVLAKTIKPPVWPADMFGQIDQAKAQRGAQLFQTNCAKCHINGPGQAPDLHFALTEIGTDPNRAENFAKPISNRPANDVLAELIHKIKQKDADERRLSESQRAELEGGRPSVWRAIREYAARPLSAVWATAPYLHNNSVPTLYDLLLPAAQRPKKFMVGEREYDPAKLGYLAKSGGNPEYEFDTSLSGNRNTGHEYGTGLTEAERLELLEYLKSL